MCGICGYVSQTLIPNEKLVEMNDTMYHRGPNDSGTWEWVGDYYAVGLAQRRLSILDLSPLGHQPMLSENKNVIIVFNGEIYNYQVLKKELMDLGYRFHSNCDTEVIIAAYQEWGCDCFAKLNGMFAIALFDQVEGKVILARDRIGKKPLYYYHAGKDFVFGSELKPLMKYPDFKKNIDLSMVEDFLCNKYIAAPNTIFKDTYKMIPGTYLIYQDGEITQHTFWDIVKRKKECGKEIEKEFHKNKDDLKGLLKNAVEERLVADVPVGTFLSGGIDSTLVTAIAQTVTDTPVKTFSIGFYDKERNEAPYAAEIAKHIGTQHKELYVGEEEILEMLKNLPFYYDEPFSDSSQLPTMLVSKLASEDITVALSGDGGDELFCGYKMYDWTWVAQHADFIGNIMHHVPGMSHMEEKMPPELRAFINNREKGLKTQLYIDVIIEEAEKLVGKQNQQIKYRCEEKLDYRNWQERRMILDMMTYLPDEILAKTDRASMKYSLEVRCPILDYRIIEESFRIPHGQKYHNFDKKHILKEVTYDYVPKSLLDRPKKGFGVPLRKWLRTVLKPEIVKYADSTILKRQGIFVPEAVKALIQKQELSDKIMYSSMLWSFYVFQTWYQMYIEDLWN
ncbi:MAG: asparagine synthase (glutamine-hydrolyzing) [Lachnospiraceae bacterium]|nr:asparagine synthase (glutamine-hydrolyzing) [Lachnospiraceae bacterium]